MQTPETRLLQPGEGGSELVQHRGDAQPVNAQKKSDADDEEMADDDDVLCATCCVDQGDTAEEAGCKCCSFNCCCIALILLFFIGGFVGYLYLIAHPRGTNALGSCMNILLENYPACSVDECNTPTALVFGCSTRQEGDEDNETQDARRTHTQTDQAESETDLAGGRNQQ